MNLFNAKFNDRTILYNNGIMVPNRNSFLDETLINQDIHRIKNGMPIIYTANYVKEYNSFYGGNVTQLLTIGILQSGLKVSVLIKDIDIYFEVFPSDFVNAEPNSDMQLALDQLDNCDISPQDAYRTLRERFPSVMKAFCDKIDILERETSSYMKTVVHRYIYNVGPRSKFVGIRMHYKNLSLYKNATFVAKTNGGAYMYKELFVTTYSKGNLIDVIAARNDVSFGTWMKLSNYKRSDIKNKVSRLEFNIEISINDFTKINPHDYEKLAISADSMNIYRSIFMCIDIESANISDVIDIKSENNDKGILDSNNSVFNIGCVVSLESDNKETNYRINIINTEAPAVITSKHYKRLGVPNSFTIVTANTRETLLAFIKIMAEIKPDFVLGYNSLDFDIPQLLIALRVNNLYDKFYTDVSLLLGDNIAMYKYIYKHNGIDYHYNKSGYTFWSNMKTTSMVSGISNNIETKEGIKLKVNNAKLSSMKIANNKNKDYHDIAIPGIIMLDVMLISWKKFPNENNKGGMNHYLKKCGLKEKLDVPYYKIWLFYRMSKSYDILVEPHTIPKLCKHGLANSHPFTDDKGETHTCEDHTGYYLGKNEINVDVYNALDGQSLIDNIQRIVEYCSYDAEGALTLVKIYSFMMEKRKFCSLVNLTLEKVVYRADVTKVENGMRKTLYKNGYSYIEETLLLCETNRPVFHLRKIMEANQNMMLYHIRNKAPKNTGAEVKIHVKGKICHTYIINGKPFTCALPVSAADFASLYPSILMAYNACNTTIIFNVLILKKLIETYPELEYTTIKTNDLLAASKFPVEMNEYFTEFYRTAFRDNEFYIISHKNNKDNYSIYAKFLHEYFGIRGATKTKMGDSAKKADAILDQMLEDKTYKAAFATDNKGCKNLKSYLEKELFEHNDEYRNYKIEYQNQLGEQLAVKVIMNTLYGALDYNASPLYSPLIASIITHFGRKYLNISNKICLREGKTLIYNDTDSTYYHHHPDDFLDIVTRYVNGEFDKDRFRKKMVTRSIRLSSDIKSLREYCEKKIKTLISAQSGDDKIYKIQHKLNNLPETMFTDRLNAEFARVSEGNYLRQVYEETLYPAVYCMLKKYFGLIHGHSYTDVNNFTMNDMLLRGVKLRTANCTNYEKEFSIKMLNRIIREDDTPIRDVVFQELNTKITEPVNYNDLVIYENVARYKAGVKNKILGMIPRIEMLHETTSDPKLKSLYRIPFELENVYYICVKNNKPYCIMGRKNAPKKCDLYEYTTVVEYLYNKYKQGKADSYKEVDELNYIMSVAATCAQLLSYVEDSDFGYYDGIENKDYTKCIAKYIRRYCTEFYAAKEENIKISNDMSIYKSYIRKNKRIFNVLIDEYLNIGYDVKVTKLAKSMIHKMINVANKRKFSNKLINIANYSFIDFGTLCEDFVYNADYKNMYNRDIDEDYIEILRTCHNNITPAMESLFVYLNAIRDEIVDQFFVIIKSEAFRDVPECDDGQECNDLRVVDLRMDRISYENIEKLAHCESLFRFYCGIRAMCAGTIKFYYMNKKIEFEEL